MTPPLARLPVGTETVLGQVADDAYSNTLGHAMIQEEERWVEVARAVREAIEAEQ